MVQRGMIYAQVSIDDLLGGGDEHIRMYVFEGQPELNINWDFSRTFVVNNQPANVKAVPGNQVSTGRAFDPDFIGVQRVQGWFYTKWEDTRSPLVAADPSIVCQFIYVDIVTFR
jgi:hypothetical protein